MTDENAAGASERVMALLAAGVPLSLLCDLARPEGPDSAAILLEESGGAMAIDLAAAEAAAAAAARSAARGA